MILLRNIWDWVGGQIVGEVPEDDAVCEFDCRKPQCTEREWENCPRRLQHAAGQLMPAKDAACAVRLVDGLARENPLSASFPVGADVISGDIAGDEAIGSPEVSIPVMS